MAATLARIGHLGVVSVRGHNTGRVHARQVMPADEGSDDH
jgi:hypothetical protein